MTDASIAAAPRGSCFADAAAARLALQLAAPMIEAALPDREVCGSGFLYIVIMDPALGPDEVDFEQAVLLEHGFGDRSRWDADYAAFARAKARITWQRGVDSHRLQGEQPHRLRAGDSLLWGSACLDGIVVGVSGAHAWFDEAFALAIAANLRAIAQRSHAAARERNELFAPGAAGT